MKGFVMKWIKVALQFFVAAAKVGRLSRRRDERPKRGLCRGVFCLVSRIPSVESPQGRSRHVRRGRPPNRSCTLSN